MYAATSRQKAFIRKMLVQFGVPRSEFFEPANWKISKEEASSIISEILILARCNFNDLREIICDNLEGRSILKYVTKTVEELEEGKKQATYDPTSEDWLDQQACNDDISQKDWIHESQADALKEQEAVV